MEKKFKTKCIDLATGGTKIVVMHKEDAQDLDLKNKDRVEIIPSEGKAITAIIDLTDTFVSPGQVGLFREVYRRLGKACYDDVTIVPKTKPRSIKYIKEKLNGKTHSEEEIKEIIKDLMEEELSDVELTSWITAIYVRGLDSKETVALTKAIVNSGEKLNLKSKRIYDKHCIGGVPGNRTTMLAVPILAAAGLTVPKTSSRAITSPAGTADTMEVLCPVALTKDEVEKVVNTTGGCVVWGGAVNLAAADDKLIRIRHPLSLDPRGMLLASILAKKKAVGATDVIIDIPIGHDAKIKSKEDATILAKQFNSIGRELGMNVQSLITKGDHPIGSAIGPALEAIETLKILKGEKVSPELTEKTCQLSGVLLEVAGVSDNGRGTTCRILSSGKADKKFRQIIELQGGDPEVSVDDIKIGKKSYTVKAETNGRIHDLNNKGISAVVRAAGAPQEKTAGMYLHVEQDDKVKKGQDLFTIYANSERKIDQALEVYDNLKPVVYSKIILDKVI